MILFNPSLRNKGLHIFPKSIRPKVNNMIAKLAYYEAEVQFFKHYAMETILRMFCSVFFLLAYFLLFFFLTPVSWAVEYTSYTSAEGYDSLQSVSYDTKQSDAEAPVILELWGMQSILSLPTLPVVVAPDSVLSVGQIELFDI